jgi:hypothetical protein
MVNGTHQRPTSKMILSLKITIKRKNNHKMFYFMTFPLANALGIFS